MMRFGEAGLLAKGALFVVLGLRPETDKDFLKAVGITEGTP